MTIYYAINRNCTFEMLVKGFEGGGWVCVVRWTGMCCQGVALRRTWQ